MKIFHFVALVAFLFTTACGTPPPPSKYSIDSQFSDEQADSIRVAHSMWCEKVGYCPEEVSWHREGRIVASFDYEHFGRKKGSAAFNCSLDSDLCYPSTIYVDMSNPINYGPTLIIMAAHEIGHYEIDVHTATGLMTDTLNAGDPDLVFEIDALAEKLWREGAEDDL